MKIPLTYNLGSVRQRPCQPRPSCPASAAYAKVRKQLATRLAAMKTCIGPTACW
jgi:hypothetical protein